MMKVIMKNKLLIIIKIREKRNLYVISCKIIILSKNNKFSNNIYKEKNKKQNYKFNIWIQTNILLMVIKNPFILKNKIFMKSLTSLIR